MNFLDDLNPEQLEAVTTLDKALLVLSGAGTGKTKVLTTKIAYILEKDYAFSSQILAVTFSNRAAKEMKYRLDALTNCAEGVWLGTFHSICAKMLRHNADSIGINPNFTIIDADDQRKLIKQILKELNLDPKIANSTLSKISRWKDKGLSYDDNMLDVATVESKIYKIYQERLMSYDSLDFGDLLLYAIRLLKTNNDVLQKYRDKFKYILVDEYQDTNMCQYCWIRMLSPSGEGLCCVGDDDQAIYSWRGAEVGNILRFENDFPNTQIIKLEQNYRSTGYILGAAASLIENNESRLGKTVWTNSGDGEKVKIKTLYNGFEEAQYVVSEIDKVRLSGVSYGDIAILVRAGFQTREFEERLIANEIPYRIVGGLRFYDRQEIKDILAYMRLIYQPNDSLAFERIINIPKRGIGASAVSKFHEYSKAHGVSLYKAANDILQQNMLRPSLHRSLTEFLQFIEGVRNDMLLTPAEIAKKIINDTGYFDALSKENTIESQTRMENLKELVLAIDEFDDLATFIEHVSLVVDAKNANTEELVSVLTLHSSKGLEFHTVFLAGWEEGLFPHNLSLVENNVEEERRLAYVGITRARKKAYITHTLNRKVYNQWQVNTPSRFLSEISKQNLDIGDTKKHNYHILYDRVI